MENDNDIINQVRNIFNMDFYYADTYNDYYYRRRLDEEEYTKYFYYFVKDN